MKSVKQTPDAFESISWESGIETQVTETQPSANNPDDTARRLSQNLLECALSRPNCFPLSMGQRAQWFLHRLAPESAAYNVAFVARIVSTIDPAALRLAFERVVERHAVLRTTYHSTDTEPCQRVHSTTPLDFEQIAASAWSPDDLDAQVQTEYARPFDLEAGPVLRLRLFTVAPNNHVFLLVIHHIACDGWSTGVILRDFRRFYESALEGRPVDAPPPERSYVDFVRYQAELLNGLEGAAHWNYWKSELAGELPSLEMPVDHPWPAAPSGRGASHHFSVDGETWTRLKELAGREGVTPFTVLLAAYQVLLMRHCNQEDVVVGTPLYGRHEEYGDVVGYFVNPAPVRGKISGNPSFRVFLRQIWQKVLDASTHGEDFPFALLVEALQPARGAGRTPIFQTLFNLLSANSLGPLGRLLYGSPEDPPVAFGPFQIQPFPLDQEEGQFDLALDLLDYGTRIIGALKYNPDILDADSAARIAERYRVLLRAISDNPDVAVAELPLLSDFERDNLQRVWNATTRNYPIETTLTRLFEERVERDPDRPALVFEDETLGYREFNARVNRLAWRLRKMGVGPRSKPGVVSTIVGLLAERSIEMLVGMYAIVKAGGAYLPLDPSNPPERLAFKIRDAAVKVVLAQERFIDSHLRADASIDAQPDYAVLALDRVWEKLADESAENPPALATPDDVAYVIFTSGSTGRPKGVEVPHRGICNRLIWMQDEYRLNSDDRVLQKTSFDFDVSVWEFFWPLQTGARLVIARPDGHKDSLYLSRIIETEKIGVVHFVPSMLQIFLEDGDPSLCSSLRHVFCSGEALDATLVRRFFERMPLHEGKPIRLHNLYGPTEASVDVTYWECRPEDEGSSVPIGRPIANTQIHILDSRLQPSPVGVPGELHIGGVQLALGYLNRPELSAERFIPDPFSKKPGARLYKTGDLARWRADGAIEYLGRLDFQVKIRGFRIELGEIEAAISAHPDVVQCVVVARRDESGDGRLVAYVQSAENMGRLQTEIRDALKKRLPDYMIPAVFVAVESFPLTGSGKVDRKALPDPGNLRPELATSYVAPSGDLENMLAKQWRELLKLERIGAHDNFFELGGHSLLLAQAHARLRAAGRDLTIVDMFQHPTIRSLAEFLGRPNSDDGAAVQKAQDRASLQRRALGRKRPPGAKPGKD
jgi:amino acid adenylation domain-containing protein